MQVAELAGGTSVFLACSKVNENGIRFIYTTGSRPTDYSGDQGNLGGAYEAASRDDGGSSQTDTGKSGGSKEEGARRANQRRFGPQARSAFEKTICGVQDRSAERMTQIFWNSESSRPSPENPSHKMKPTPSLTQGQPSPNQYQLDSSEPEFQARWEGQRIGCVAFKNLLFIIVTDK